MVREGEKTFGDVKDCEKDCFEHSMQMLGTSHALKAVRLTLLFHMVVLKCSWRRGGKINGGPFAEDGPRLEHFVLLIPLPKPVRSTLMSRSIVFDITLLTEHS